MYKTRVNAYKKKFNEIKDFEKTPQLRVRIDADDTRRVKFSLFDSVSDEEVIGDEEYENAKAIWDDSVSDEEVIGDEEYENVKAIWDDDEMKDLGGLGKGEQYPPLEIVEPHENRTTRERQIVSFENNGTSDEGEPRDWIKDIQVEINYLGMKCIDIDKVFSVMVKIPFYLTNQSS